VYIYINCVKYRSYFVSKIRVDHVRPSLNHVLYRHYNTPPPTNSAVTRETYNIYTNREFCKYFILLFLHFSPRQITTGQTVGLRRVTREESKKKKPRDLVTPRPHIADCRFHGNSTSRQVQDAHSITSYTLCERTVRVENVYGFDAWLQPNRFRPPRETYRAA